MLFFGGGVWFVFVVLQHILFCLNQKYWNFILGFIPCFLSSTLLEILQPTDQFNR